MAGAKRFLRVAVVILGLASIAFGIGFIWNGYSYETQLRTQLATEEVTLGSEEGNIVDTPEEARNASETVKGHRTERYGTYAQTGRDSPERAQFLNALTLENSLNLVQLAFGVTTIAMAIGAFMILNGIALVGVGLALGL